MEKNKGNKKIMILELNGETEQKLEQYISEIETLLEGEEVPEVLNKAGCKKCAYYEYCYV